MKDGVINFFLFVVSLVVIAGAIWYVSPSRPTDVNEQIDIISKRNIINFTLEKDIFGGTVFYSYVGEPLPDRLVESEVVELRTPTSFTQFNGIENEGEEDEQVILGLVAYSKDSFIEKDGDWYFVEYDSAPEDVFFRATGGGFFSKLIARPAYAVTFYSGGGDGHVFYSTLAIDWNTVHDNTTGTPATTTATAIARSSMTSSSGGKGSFSSTQIYRAFLPFDTSSIPAAATISAASLNVYVTTVSDGDNDAQGYITVVQPSQASHDDLVQGDYDNCGAVNNPTEGIATGQRKDLTSISTSAYLTFTLNATGEGWIAQSGDASNCSSTNGWSCFGLREGHDTTDTPIATPPAGSTYDNNITFSTSEQTGTSQDPYLSVTYSTPSSFVPWLFNAF